MPQLDVAVPVLPARNLKETIEFYQSLGFELAYQHPVLSEYIILRLGALELQFFEWPQLDAGSSFTGSYMRVGDVDAMYQKFAGARLPARGIPSLGGIERRPWGMREFHLIDCNGNLLRVGEPVKKLGRKSKTA
jgi:catechol 2,3-dioxygenase-like lactoylglutathione lyase family enzyme